MTHMIISVKNGKFHALLCEPADGEAFRSAKTVCGMTVKPMNYFNDAVAKDRYVGGRISDHMCKNCVG